MCADLTIPPAFELPAGVFTPAVLSPADLPDIFAVEERSHPHPWRLQNFQSSLASHTCIGLRHEQHWVAYGIVSFIVGEAELLLFVVDKPWQGRGVGSFFLSLLLRMSQRRADTMFLEVRASNHAAIALYEKLGFNQVGLRPGYYPAGSRGGREDALLYAVDLTCLPDGGTEC